MLPGEDCRAAGFCNFPHSAVNGKLHDLHAYQCHISSRLYVDEAASVWDLNAANPAAEPKSGFMVQRDTRRKGRNGTLNTTLDQRSIMECVSLALLRVHRERSTGDSQRFP
jgi:hypothetical protein